MNDRNKSKRDKLNVRMRMIQMAHVFGVFHFLVVVVRYMTETLFNDVLHWDWKLRYIMTSLSTYSQKLSIDIRLSIISICQSAKNASLKFENRLHTIKSPLIKIPKLSSKNEKRNAMTASEWESSRRKSRARILYNNSKINKTKFVPIQRRIAEQSMNATERLCHFQK